MKKKSIFESILFMVLLFFNIVVVTLAALQRLTGTQLIIVAIGLLLQVLLISKIMKKKYGNDRDNINKNK